jgi:hypothetical protein
MRRSWRSLGLGLPAWAIGGALLSAACGHAPPPAPKATEQAVSSIGDIAGEWVADDAMDWGYKLTIEPSGAIDAWMDRGKIGRCKQKGQAVAAGPKAFAVTYSLEECHRDAHRSPDAPIRSKLEVTSFTGKDLSVVVTFENAVERRTYHRMAGS